MTSILKDPLLTAGRGLTLIMQGLMGLAAAALLIGLPTLLLYQNKAHAVLAEETGVAGARLPISEIAIIMILVLAVVVALFLFFGRLRSIVGTVAHGDPFVPENAQRLSQMGWLMVATQLLLIPAAALGVRVIEAIDAVKDVGDTDIDAGLDLSGILLIVVLFILARVFRHGAAMREDLEGTV